MRNLRRITVIMVMVCLMIGQSGCAGIFDSTKSEVRIAKKVLKGKYNEDFEIITSNDSLLTEVARPRLSSVTQPLYDIGAVAMRLLTKMMNKEEIEQKTIELPHGIFEKGSTKE